MNRRRSFHHYERWKTFYDDPFCYCPHLVWLCICLFQNFMSINIRLVLLDVIFLLGWPWKICLVYQVWLFVCFICLTIYCICNISTWYWIILSFLLVNVRIYPKPCKSSVVSFIILFRIYFSIKYSIDRLGLQIWPVRILQHPIN